MGIMDVIDVCPNVHRCSAVIREPNVPTSSEVGKSQWVAIAIDQLLGPDTSRVFNDASADIAAGNMSAEKAAKAIEQSWQQNKM